MKMPRNIGPVHFVGIGGIGMSGIAEILHDQGYKVRGSDSSENPNVSVVSTAPAEAAEAAAVTVTHSRLLDDSVEATRNEVGLRRAGDVWRVEEVRSSVSCKPGRGHRDFSTEPCV